MSIEPCTKAEFEEALREDGIEQPRPQLTGAEIFSVVEAKMQRLINTSAADCSITLTNSANSNPVETIGEITQVLVMMNHQGIDKKSHRQAMLRAARKAMASLAEYPA